LPYLANLGLREPDSVKRVKEAKAVQYSMKLAIHVQVQIAYIVKGFLREGNK
jgi:hypothetical protein